MIDQLSVFAENSKGTMYRVAKIVSDAGIDIVSVVTNDSAEYGIIRMLTVLRSKGYTTL